MLSSPTQGRKPLQARLKPNLAPGLFVKLVTITKIRGTQIRQKTELKQDAVRRKYPIGTQKGNAVMFQKCQWTTDSMHGRGTFIVSSGLIDVAQERRISVAQRQAL